MSQPHHDVCAHYLNLNFSSDFLSESETKLCMALPYPIHKPMKTSKFDLINKYHEDVAAYSDKFSVLAAEVDDSVLDQDYQHPYVSIPRGLLDFCNSKKCMAPFPGDYNPYYASGFLEYFELGENRYLVRPDVNNTLCVTNLSRPRKIIKLQLQDDLNQPVLGIRASWDASSALLLVRQKNELKLLSLEDVKEIVTVRWSKQFNKPILDACLKQNHLGVVFDDLTFELLDFERETKLSLKSLDVNSVVNFSFLDENSLGVLSQNSVKIIDGRSRDCRILRPQLDNCDVLTAFRVHGDLIYVASRHSLLYADVKSLENPEYCSHLMKTSPCYMDVIEEFESTFICLASQSSGDKVVFEGKPISSLPLGVPSIEDCLEKCQLTRELSLQRGLKERLQYSTAGIKLLSEDNEIFLYTSNSLGELFKQKVSGDPTDEESVDLLYNWVNKLPVSSPTLRFTNLVNLSDAHLALSEQTLEENLVKFETNKCAPRFFKKFAKNYSVKNLGELAANFSTIWDDEEDEFDDEEELVPEVPAHEKVSSWITSSEFH